jgi:hypothetical protein
MQPVVQRGARATVRAHWWRIPLKKPPFG